METIIDGDEDEQLGMPEDMEATNRAPARVQDVPGDSVEEYVRNAFIIPYSASQTQGEDEDADVHEPEHEMQEEVHEPEAEVGEEPPAYVPEPVEPASVPPSEARYGSPPKVLKRSSAVWGQGTQ